MPEEAIGTLDEVVVIPPAPFLELSARDTVNLIRAWDSTIVIDLQWPADR